jgi:hypothetical protein
MTPTVIKGGKANKPATAEKIAVMEFGPIARIARLPKAKRQKNTDNLVASVRGFSLLAVELVAYDKARLVERVAKDYDTFGPLLMGLAHAADDAKALLQLLQAAEVRLAVAIAVVESDEQPDDDDGAAVGA